jgi:hypothetical protein
MDHEDLPPHTLEPDEENFASEMGSTLGRAVWMLTLMALMGAIVWAAIRVFGH